VIWPCTYHKQVFEDISLNKIYEVYENNLKEIRVPLIEF